MTSSSEVQKLTSGIIRITGITVFDSEIETGIENAFLLFSATINSIDSPSQKKLFAYENFFTFYHFFQPIGMWKL